MARHRVVALFQDMADQADGAREHADAPHDLPGQAEFATDGTDGSGGVDWQHLSRQPLCLEIWQRIEDEATAHIRPGA